MQFNVKHTLLFVSFIAFYTLMLIICRAIPVLPHPGDKIDPFKEYGAAGAFFLYTLRILTLVALPLSCFNFLGLFLYDAFPERPKLKSSPILGPFLCFRVVTRGNYPDMVKNNVKRNYNTCVECGLDNFVFEVVTDRELHLPKQNRVRELVVPPNYKTKNGTLYKARALQYCLEDGVNILNEEDWIVHLDEETLLTKDSVIGILNFIADGEHTFGQGVITYANEEIVNWLITLGDLVRVGVDYGQFRWSFNYFHKPYFSWKGSYVVANAGVERKIGFDFGMEGSIAEDCFFAMKAIHEGYTFGFIHGDMWEKSPFTIYDWIKQRSRWMQGIWRVYRSQQIPRSYKWGLRFIVAGWLTMPFTTLNGLLAGVLPIPTYRLFDAVCVFTFTVYLFLYMFGSLKSFSRARLGLFRYICVILLPLLISPVIVVVENISVCMCMFTDQGKFHIVDKDVTGKDKGGKGISHTETLSQTV